jgi:hypothetical protein
MKITKTDLRKIIEEELGSIQQENVAGLAKASLGRLRQGLTGKTKQDVGKQSQLEKNVTGLLQQMQSHMAMPGQQVNTRTVKLLQKAFKTMGGQDLGTGASGELELGTKGAGTGKGEDATRTQLKTPARRGVDPFAGSKSPLKEEPLDEDALVAEIIKRLGGE